MEELKYLYNTGTDLHRTKSAVVATENTICGKVLPLEFMAQVNRQKKLQEQGYYSLHIACLQKRILHVTYCLYYLFLFLYIAFHKFKSFGMSNCTQFRHFILLYVYA